MTTLFSSFDPQVNSFPLNWTSAVFIRIALTPPFFLINNQWGQSFNKIFILIYNEFFVILRNISNPGNSGLILGLFIYLFLNNFLGLLPYIFTRSRHLVFTLTLGLPLWLGHNILSWTTQPKECLAHLIPLGTPPILIMFICFIETLRNGIRPLTLSIRLIANITAGHLLFSLLSVGLTFSVLSLKIYLILFMFLLLIFLELGVRVIQSYVFTLLSSLYIKEHVRKKLESFYTPKYSN